MSDGAQPDPQVKKKMTAPKGPPPKAMSMASFKPKERSAEKPRNAREAEYKSDSDDDDESGDDAAARRNQRSVGRRDSQQNNEDSQHSIHSPDLYRGKSTPLK